MKNDVKRPEYPVQDTSAKEATPTSNQLRLFMLPYAWISSLAWDFVANFKKSDAKKIA